MVGLSGPVGARRFLRRDVIFDSFLMAIGALGWAGLVATGRWVPYLPDALLLLIAYCASGAAYAAINDVVIVRRCRAKGSFFVDPLQLAFIFALPLGFLLVVRWFPAILLRPATSDGFDLIYAVFGLFSFGLCAGGLAGHIAFERLRHVRRWYRRAINPTSGKPGVEFGVTQV